MLGAKREKEKISESNSCSLSRMPLGWYSNACLVPCRMLPRTTVARPMPKRAKSDPRSWASCQPLLLGPRGSGRGTASPDRPGHDADSSLADLGHYRHCTNTIWEFITAKKTHCCQAQLFGRPVRPARRARCPRATRSLEINRCWVEASPDRKKALVMILTAASIWEIRGLGTEEFGTMHLMQGQNLLGPGRPARPARRARCPRATPSLRSTAAARSARVRPRH